MVSMINFSFMFVQIILPQLNSISANLITPYVDEFISDISDKDKVRTLKKMDLKELGVPLQSIRFISANNVRLRESPNIKSEVIDMTRLGQVVIFLEKNRNWTNVGELMTDHFVTEVIKQNIKGKIPKNLMVIVVGEYTLAE